MQVTFTDRLSHGLILWDKDNELNPGFTTEPHRVLSRRNRKNSVGLCLFYGELVFAYQVFIGMFLFISLRCYI